MTVSFYLCFILLYILLLTRLYFLNALEFMISNKASFAVLMQYKMPVN